MRCDGIRSTAACGALIVVAIVGAVPAVVVAAGLGGMAVTFKMAIYAIKIRPR